MSVDAATSVGAATGTARSRVEQIMGTAIGLDLRDSIDPAVVEAAFELLRDIDARFSTYRPDSEISRLGRGELTEAECSADVLDVLAMCEEVRVQTGGAFDIRAGRGSAGPDPSGLVKGWALERAAQRLDAGGARNFSLNGGGDIVARGLAGGRPWRIGIRHPDLADRVAAVIAVSDLAVATSGLYERGGHIVDPRTGRAPHGLRSVTVVGPSLTFADAYATAAFVMGLDGLRWIATLPGYGACGITTDDRLVSTPLFDKVRAPFTETTG
jgi:FAD:protein FMN transferase